MLRIDRSGASEAFLMIFCYRRITPWLMVANAVRPCWWANLKAFLWWGPEVDGKRLPPGTWSY